MKSIISAAPGLVNPGVKDESGAVYSRVAAEYPQHLPKIFLWAGKGPTTLDPSPEQLLAGSERNLMYGDDAFAQRSKYFTHQTMFANAINAEGNATMNIRLVPPDVGPKATIRGYIDVLVCEIDDYERNTDGSIKVDTNGDPIVLGQIAAGHRVKHVIEFADSHAEAENFGLLTQTAGTQTGPLGETSIRVPIFEFEVSYYGEPGNLAGIRFWPQNEVNSSLPTKMINSERAYPYNMAVIVKNTATGSPVIQDTLFGEKISMFTFKPDVVDPLTERHISIEDVALDNYRNLEDTRYPIVYGEFGRFHLYTENLKTLLRQFQLAEAAFLTPDSDFSDEEADLWMFNFLTGTDLKNVPYHSFIIVNDVSTVRYSAKTNIYAKGGSDGTLSLENFAAAVSQYMDRYADPDDELMDVAYHVESHFYDSGFPLSTKYALIKAIAERKDTYVCLSPFEFGERKLTASEEYSVSASLLDRVAMYPESIEFGTSAYRVMIQGVSAKIRGSSYKNDHFPTLYEIAIKSARYMGAGNGKFKSGSSPEGIPNNIIESMYDFSIPFTSDSVKLRQWDVGLNWVARNDREQFYFPAMQSVYPDSTSVLNGYINGCILAFINKIIAKAQRKFGGRSDLTPAQTTEETNNFIVAECENRFDGRAIVTPKAHFTTMDEVRNYSWTVPVEVELNGMRTVMKGYAVARRRTA